MSEKICFIVTGPNGGGKQTFVDNGLRAVLDGELHHLSIGEEMRKEQERGTKLGNILAEYTSKKLLAPNEYTFRVANNWFAERKSPSIVVLDGIPRRPDQIPIAIDFIKQHEMKGVVVMVNTPEEICFDRLMANKRDRADDGDEVKVRQALAQWREFTIPAFNELCRLAPELNIDVVRCDGTNMETDAKRYALSLAIFRGLPIVTGI